MGDYTRLSDDELLRRTADDREAFGEFYDRHVLTHVRAVDFFDTFDDVSGEDLDWFWQQWFYETDRLDYGIGDVNVEQAGGEYVTSVEVLRLGDAWMPVTLQVGAETVALDSRERRQVVEVRSAERPTEAVVDPEFRLLDMDRSNNTRAF